MAVAVTVLGPTSCSEGGSDERAEASSATSTSASSTTAVPPTSPSTAGLGTTPSTSGNESGGDRREPSEVPACSGDLGRPSPLGAETTRLCSIERGGVRVDVGMYPRPDHEGEPWSAWGQGIVLADGRHLSAIGDHRGTDGASYLFELDPAATELRRVADIAAAVEGGGGAGKVHGQLVAGRDGEVYLATYWGDRDALEPRRFPGDHLLRYDPDERSLQDLGAPVPGFGVPSLSGSADGRLLYGEAVDPAQEDDVGPFFVYDVDRAEVVYRGSEAGHAGFRRVLVGGDGRAWFSSGGDGLSAYDPETGLVDERAVTAPGTWLRAATTPAGDGTVYGATREPDALFALRPDGSIETFEGLGATAKDVASMALAPDGETVYFVPGAHGRAWRDGTPLLALDTTTGRTSEVVRLNDLIEPTLGLRAGGTYGVTVSPEGDRVHVTLNAGDPGSDDAFGEVVLAVVHLTR